MATRNVFFGKSSRAALALAIGFCGLAPSVVAEDVARALVTYGNANVKLCTIDDTGAWTAGDNVITAGDGHTTLPWRTVYRDGCLYVLDMIAANNAAYGRLNRYSVSGEFLDTVVTIHGAMLDDFLFSPDGKHIYFSDFAGTNHGNIWHYDVETGSTNIVVNTGGAPRQLSWGPDDGFLYVADRGKKALMKIDLTEGTATGIASGMNMLCGLYYDESDGVFYTSNTDGAMYRVQSDGSSKTSLGTAADSSRQVVYVNKVNGLITAASLTKNPAPAVVVQLREEDNPISFTHVLEFSGSISSLCEIPLYSPSAEWKLDESGNVISYAATGYNVEIVPTRLLQGGVAGVDGNAVWFNASSYGVFGKSAGMIPTTDDFTVSFWAGMSSEATFASRRTLFSNALGASGDVSVSVGVADHPNVLEVSFVTSEGARLSATSSADFANGNWHHVALCRHGTSMKAYVDGSLAAELTLPADEDIAQTADWHLGATATGGEPAGAGACMDDVRLYLQSLPANAVRLMSEEFSAGALPSSVPELPAVSSLPAGLGAQVFHRRAIDAAISDSMLFKAGDGSLYLAFGRGDGFRDADRETTFFRSADNGQNWSANAAPALSAGSVSLFERDGNLFAIGLKNVAGAASRRTFAVWQLDSVAWVEKSSFEGSADNEYALGTSSVRYYNSDKRFYKSAVCYYGGTNAYPAYISFKYENGAFSGGTATVIGSNGSSIIGGVCTVTDVVPGDTLTVASDNNACWAFYSFVDRPTGSKFRVGPERTRIYKYNSASGNTALAAWSLPGGSKPYSIKYDSTSGMYWAVTVPVTNRQETAGGVYADTVAKRIGVYASPDLTEWWPCGILIDSEAATFRAPSIEFCGDDLVIAYGVAADDGVGGARGFDQPNYLAVRRVANFRTALVPEKPDGRYLLAANGGTVKRYWKTSSGMWLPGKTFATGSYGGASLSTEVGIAVGDNVVYVGGEGSKGRIFVFNRKGKYLKTLVGMPNMANNRVDSIRLAANGKDLIVTDAYDSKAVYRVDPKTDTWTELVSASSPKGSGITNRLRDALEAADGTLYVASQGGRVSVFNTQPEVTFVKQLGDATCTGLALDVEGNRLFYSTQGGLIKKYDLASTGTGPTEVQNRSSMGDNSALQLLWHDGRLLVSDAKNFLAYEVNPDGLNEEDVFLAGAMSFTRYAFIDENAKPGFVLSFR